MDRWSVRKTLFLQMGELSGDGDMVCVINMRVSEQGRLYPGGAVCKVLNL